MAFVTHRPDPLEWPIQAPQPRFTGYIWGIAMVAAMGGLLFGYDWVVIGGARQFYESYFGLTSKQMVGWANSCALTGCFVGSLAAGYLGNRFGRKRILLVAGVLFAVSSVWTGWSYQFQSFILWRIIGGVAIGLSSNISPLYIAEISPASIRGRLVSLNQFAIVVGILLAQVVNWRIAQPIPDGLSGAQLLASWNVQQGWRWMFSAVAIPAAVFTLASLFIPESPRWLLARGLGSKARDTLRRIGGQAYADSEIHTIVTALEREAEHRQSWRVLLRPGFRKVLLIAVLLAFLQQWTGINILFNYAAEIYRSAGYGANDIFLNIVITGTINLLFTVLAMAIVDRLGRRKMMIFGCAGIGISHLLAGLAYRASWHGLPILVLTLCAIACYAMTLAPVTWVLIAEIFPNRIRSLGVSLAVSALWVASFLLTYTFPLLNGLLGSAGVFFAYAGICLLGGIFVLSSVHETKGQSLEEIEAGVLERALRSSAK
jgi:sugar porter (SP) family MFS transporter